ncbi:MAG: hypothetical protein PUA79_00645 [Lachnospiraceae bacterium]|nr:hypothetical protein [Lachnospiraceae bacterium]
MRRNRLVNLGLIVTTTFMLVLSGCGNKDNSDVATTEVTAEVVENTESTESVEDTEEATEVTESTEANTEVTAKAEQQETKKEAKKETKKETKGNTTDSKPAKSTEASKPAKNTTDSKPAANATENKPAKENTDSKPAGNNSTAGNTDSKPSKTNSETTPAHVHKWVEKTKVVHHPAETKQEDRGKYVTVVDVEAYDEQPSYTDYICKTCYYKHGGLIVPLHGQEAIDAHALYHTNTLDESCQVGTVTIPTGEVIHHDAITHQEWQPNVVTVTVKEAWDETVVTGYVCSECGATK